jgi:hypothetical protein
MICVKIDIVIMISTLRGFVEVQNTFARYNMLEDLFIQKTQGKCRS